jgi:antitoxin component of MazEF toxin-antitoxin module
MCYNFSMKMLKVRRVGNSNMVALPKEWEAAGFGPGAYVLVERDKAGEIRILRAGNVPARVEALADEMVEKHAEALRILADHDASSG